MSAIYRYDITVPATAIDENGHLNNVEYVRWMQTAAIAHAHHTPCARETSAVGATWIVRTHRIEYLRPAFEGEQIAILTWISSIGKVRSQRQYKFFRVTDQAVLANCETDWVFIDSQKGTPLAIPVSVANAFEIVTQAPQTLALSLSDRPLLPIHTSICPPQQIL
ncbi:MAG: acyl-CoA thioesterase [Phormidesmis sp.]